ncbi:MAG TPA: beta-ketoacyl-ACP synthase 3 [Actinophytocola sp.]|nr:beta-ketoacyl-ACP synthase 3 [Actinophytocola sp.]
MRNVAVVAGVGEHVPSTVVTNAELSDRFDTSDKWIRSRTGISTRRRVAPEESTSDLAVAAGAAALKSASATGDDDVDLVVLATSTPDHSCPATAPAVARRLGLGEVPAFDIAAVCSGFVYGLAVADGMLAAGTARRVLLVGADVFSRIVDPQDRAASTVFGDGAGAVVLRAGVAGEPGAVASFDLGSDGDLTDLIVVRAGGARQPDRAAADHADRWFAMQGQAVYRHAVTRMAASARTALDRAGWTPDDVDRFVAHQANARILATVGAELGIAADRVYSNIAAVGNTVAASIPLALADAAADGELRAGDRVLLSAFGGGATWGAAALTWPDLAA